MSWKVYQQQDNYGCNMLEYFKAFQEADRDSHLYNRGMIREPEGKFEYDAINDNLPTVSWIIPTSTQSEHPGLHAGRRGGVRRQQDQRDRGQSGGLGEDGLHPQLRRERRHLRPRRRRRSRRRARRTSSSEACRSAAGFRVPCIIVSPWTAGGWVCSQPFDHTSVLQFLEKFTGVAEPNITDWRRKTFGDLTSAFRFDDGPRESAAPSRRRQRSGTRPLRIGLSPQARPARQQSNAPQPGNRRAPPRLVGRLSRVPDTAATVVAGRRHRCGLPSGVGSMNDAHPR